LHGLAQLVVAQFFHRSCGIARESSNLRPEPSTLLLELLTLMPGQAISVMLIFPEPNYI
jgi:hypothetical protein